MGIGINIKTTENQITKLEFDIWEFHYNRMTARTGNLGHAVNTQTIVCPFWSFANILGFFWVRWNPWLNSCSSHSSHTVALSLYIEHLSKQLRTAPSTTAATNPSPSGSDKIDSRWYGIIQFPRHRCEQPSCRCRSKSGWRSRLH